MEELIKISAVLIAAVIGFTLAGVAGFGGGVVILPILVWVFGLKEAIPILAISQFLGTSTRVWIHWDQINWKIAVYFGLSSIPTAILGSFIFILADTVILMRIFGVMMISLAIFTRLPIGKTFRMKLWGFVPLGAVTGLGDGFLGGVPGPFTSTFFLAYGLFASSYLGTFAIAMGLIQIPKLIIFWSNEILTLNGFLIGLGLGIIAIITAYLGKSINSRINPKLFSIGISILIGISGLSFIIRS